ncbi:MAG: metallopeptidase family protein [Alphaproteobacteria bacterium]
MLNFPPNLADIQAIAVKSLASIPEELRRFARDVVVRVEEFPDEDTLDELGLENPFDLLGLYRGVALSRKSVFHTPHNVDMVFLYRRPILDYWCESGENLADVVRHVLIHEIGHHFGFSDDDMERIENQT